VDKKSLAHPAHPITREEKKVPCSSCGQRFPRPDLREVGSEEASWSLTAREGQKLCCSCARQHGVL
jgi:hypothetical protein